MTAWHIWWAAAAAITVVWLVLLTWRLIRPHPGAHRGTRRDPGDWDPVPAPLPVMHGAPTETIPIAPVSGVPPWALPGALPPLPPQRDRWNAADATRALVVEPGWDEPDDDEPGWAEVTLPGLLDLLGGYAYPGGFPPRPPVPALPSWTEDPAPLSAAEVACFRLELETARLDGPDAADCVYDLMGGDT